MQKAMNEFMIIAAIGKKDLLQANIDGKGSRPADMQLPDVGLLGVQWKSQWKIRTRRR